ncbi:unnamed protein product [Ixodes hexagonus]
MGLPHDHSQVANLYMDWIIDIEATSKQSHLDPLITENFQPANSGHTNVSTRFARANVTGLGQFRREGDCNVTHSVESDTQEIICELVTELQFNVVTNVTYQGVTKPNVSATSNLYGVKGPFTLILRNWKPISVEFSPRFDGAETTLGGSRDCDKNEAVCLEFHTRLIRLFEYATGKVFARAVLNAARRVPFPN